MEPIYCRFCGRLLSEGCDCEAEYARACAEAKAAFIEEYENRPETLAGYAFQDLCDLRRRER